MTSDLRVPPTPDTAGATPASAAAAAAGHDPRVDALTHALIGRVADKWTMLVLEVLADHGTLRFTRLGALVGGSSQKMLTQTLRHVKRDGFVRPTVHPMVPPRVEYALTPLGLSLRAACCGVWLWAAGHLDAVERARRAFDAGPGAT